MERDENGVSLHGWEGTDDYEAEAEGKEKKEEGEDKDINPRCTVAVGREVVVLYRTTSILAPVDNVLGSGYLAFLSL
jgi:hypothetical protein